jgi:16S rRNA (cytosine967-C5)-methyltransferase
VIKYAHQYLRSAAVVIDQYDGVLPLAAFLKQYFKANPKFGSKDRKYIGHLCYTFFRTGHAINAPSTEEKIKAAVFICEPGAGEWELVVPAEWLPKWNDDRAAKWQWIISVFPGSDRKKIFLWKDELSEKINAQQFADAHLTQPDLFLRIRPERTKKVLQKLRDAEIPFNQVTENCLALPNASKIDSILEIDKEVVIQDLSSQRIAEFLQLCIDDSRITKTVWDCCAASGGKSLLACDMIKNIQLTVSDLRPSILRNLKERFDKAGIKNYHSFIADLSNEVNIQNEKFKIIICDAPCSGSGTWGRTPEQLNFFTKDKIETYSSLQKKITTNVFPYLENEGYLLYITCSVFRKENEDVVQYILQNAKMELIKSEVLTGYGQKADSMFAALIKRRG